MHTWPRGEVAKHIAPEQSASRHGTPSIPAPLWPIAFASPSFSRVLESGFANIVSASHADTTGGFEILPGLSAAAGEDAHP